MAGHDRTRDSGTRQINRASASSCRESPTPALSFPLVFFFSFPLLFSRSPDKTGTRTRCPTWSTVKYPRRWLNLYSIFTDHRSASALRRDQLLDPHEINKRSERSLFYVLRRVIAVGKFVTLVIVRHRTLECIGTDRANC